MELLYFFESIRMPVLNEFMLLITRLGEETALLVVALILFWCVDKKKGYYVLFVGFFGLVANQFLKLLCRVPRPWILDPDFTILEAARDAATGYSFPSGHSQSAVGLFGCLAVSTKNRWVRWSAIAIAVLVPVSRMYLGVHTPADVLVGSGMALILVFVLRKPVLEGKEGTMKFLLIALTTLSLGFLNYVELSVFPADMDAHNLQSGVKNAYTVVGCMAGLGAVYYIEKEHIQFRTEAVWWAQILKCLLGFGIVLLVKEGLRSPLEALFAGHMAARAVRYCLMVIVAGCIWPLTFRWFQKLGVKK